MLIKDDKVCAVFKKVHHIREEYQRYVIGNNTHLIAIEDLQRVVENMYDLAIVKTQLNFSSVFIRGMMERHKDKILIRVYSGQPLDWKRFTTVKEMCHVVIDEAEDWSVEGVTTLKEMIHEFSLESTPDSAEEAEKVSQSELLAEIAATEIMYPYEVRQGDLKRLSEKATTFDIIAKEHGLPVSVVGRALSKSYHEEIAIPIWGMVATVLQAAE